MKLSENRIKELLSKTNNISHKCGCCCRFVKLTKYTGIKLYRNEDIRDTCYYRQSDASDCNLAPKTKGKIDITMWNIQWYGYLTEVARPINNFKRSIICYLTEKLYDDCFMEFLDNSNKDNYGYITRNNKNIPVIIDFSHCESDDWSTHNPFDDNIREDYLCI